jgi:hypothetical protein
VALTERQGIIWRPVELQPIQRLLCCGNALRCGLVALQRLRVSQLPGAWQGGRLSR